LRCVAFAFLCCIAASGVNAEQDHPIVRVIKLVEGLKETSIAEGKAEQVAYTKFEYWCSTSIDTLNGAIADEKEKIEELTDSIAGHTKRKASLEKDIETLDIRSKTSRHQPPRPKKTGKPRLTCTPRQTVTLRPQSQRLKDAFQPFRVLNQRQSQCCWRSVR